MPAAHVYHVDQPTNYGEDFHWDHGGQRFFRPGIWHRVEHRIVINTPGQRDGVVQGWFDGALAPDRRDVRRDVDAFAIDVFAFSTFFGGSDPTCAPPKGRAGHLRPVRHCYRPAVGRISNHAPSMSDE